MNLEHNAFKQWYAEHTQEIEKDFFTFLKFRSISTDTAYDKDTRQCAQWLRDYLQKIGFETTLWETTRHPVVFGSYLKAGPSRPTVLIYQHYDVQPADPLELWDSPPFEPVIKNNQVYARGALDNKGQCFYSICALRAFVELSKKHNVNIKVFIEGEEESGGKGTFGILPHKKKELQADHLLIVDLDLPGAGIPGITLGMRGMAAIEVECRNSATDLHSGTHGGIALNPNRVLVTLLAKLWDEKGRVTVPHFYDAVRPVSSAELASLHTTFDEETYKQRFGIRAFSKEENYSPIESNWVRPTLELNGIGGGYTGTGFKTVIPAKAIAKISCRLVPDQDPDKIAQGIIDFLKAKAPQGIELTATMHHGSKAYRSSPEAPIAKICVRAFEKVFGKTCQMQLCGATIPIVAELAIASGSEVALIGMGLAEDNIHAPNEHFGMDRFEQGFLVMTTILHELAEK